MPESFDAKTYLQQGAWRDVRLGLHRTRELLERLGRPQDRLRIVHVAGTNGKGSTCAFIAGILQAAGYKVGLFTSPYVLRFNERIQVNREDISDDDLTAVALQVRDAAAGMDEQPTAFELITAAALLHFAQVECTAVVLEVGLGGRLDSTNVIDPVACAITPISLDHTHVLGSIVTAIAQEKAGIIKPGVPVVCFKQVPDAEAVVLAKAAEVGAEVITPNFGDVRAHAEGLHQVFSYDGICDVRLKLAGTYQPLNATMAIEVARVLRGRGFDISDADIKVGLESTVWRGRFEVVREHPYVIVDGGHNEQGAGVLAASLREYFPDGGVTFVMNVLRDKNYRAMIDATLPLASAYYCAEPPENERALHAWELADAINGRLAEQREAYATCAAQPVATACPSIALAVSQAVAAAGESGVVCCFGSLYAIADVMAALDEVLPAGR